MDEGQSLPEVSAPEMGKKHTEFADLLRRLIAFELEQWATLITLITATTIVVWWFANREATEKLAAKDEKLAAKEIAMTTAIMAAHIEETEKAREKLNERDSKIADLQRELSQLRLAPQAVIDRLAAENREMRGLILETKRRLDELANPAPRKPVPIPNAGPFDRHPIETIISKLAPVAEGKTAEAAGEFLPPLNDAKPNKLPFDDLLDAYVQRTPQKVAGELAFYKEYFGERFTWTGVVDSIEPNGDNLVVKLLPRWKGYSQGWFQFPCYFAVGDLRRLGDLDHIRNALIDHIVTLTGVMGSGYLARCQLQHVGARHVDPKSN